MNGNGRAPQIGQIIQAQEQVNALMQAEIRQNAGRIFAVMAGPYLMAVAIDDALLADGGELLKSNLRRFATLAVKAAPYVHQAQGIAKFDEQKHWADIIVPPGASNDLEGTNVEGK